MDREMVQKCNGKISRKIEFLEGVRFCNLQFLLTIFWKKIAKSR